MTKTFVVLFKETLQIRTFTSLSAVFEQFDRDDLGVSLSLLQKRNLYEDPYENNKVKIELSYTKTANEIKREKEQFL